jgi:hypothetical protein
VEPVFLAVEAKHLRWPGSRIRALLCHAFPESFAANLWHGLSGSYSGKSEISAKRYLKYLEYNNKNSNLPTPSQGFPKKCKSRYTLETVNSE